MSRVGSRCAIYIRRIDVSEIENMHVMQSELKGLVLQVAAGILQSKMDHRSRAAVGGNRVTATDNLPASSLAESAKDDTIAVFEAWGYDVKHMFP